MELREALTQIYEIRQQVAQTEVFRGYRAVTVGFSGVLAIVVAVFQSIWLPSPAGNLPSYLFLWVGAATVSMMVTGAEMLWRCMRATSPLTLVTTTLAIGQFMPAVACGGLVMLILWLTGPEVLWLLPGLWAIFFSLGIFASYRLLPRAVFWVAAWYLVAGLCCLIWAKGKYAFSPWSMGITFGFGQFLAAGILYWTLERDDVNA
ncbi:MAG: hypothetical protein ACFCD0_11955 [Gemmataceae bacterium]